MSLMITGVIDGPLTGGVPKAIQLIATSDIADLSVYGLGSPNNGGAGGTIEFTFPEVAVTKGTVLYVASETTGFTSYFGFAPDYIGGVASINGDDAIELFENGTVIDVFGAVGTDGTGEAWDYLDGWASRDPSEGRSTTFTLSEWTFSGTNALDGETSNGSAASPFPTPSLAIPTDLFISEYVAGSSFNKAIELYNWTGAAIDLAAGNYTLELYSNGSATVSQSVNLSGTIANGDVFVIAHASADAAILAEADETGANAVINFDGNDSVILRKNGAVVDAFGQIGVDPGTSWLGGSQNVTLRRKDSIAEGDTDPTNAFDTSDEWDSFPSDTFDGLGSFESTTGDDADIVINELRISSSSGAGNNVDFVELFTAPNESFNGKTLVALSGEFAPGQIDRAINLTGGVADANGFLLIAQTGNANLETGDIAVDGLNFFSSPQTFLVVDNFTGSQGDDLDTDNDGTLDTTPWGTVFASVSLIDGDPTPDFSYAATIVPPDGSFTQAGAGRLPDGTGDFVGLAFINLGADTPGRTNTPPVNTTLISAVQGSGDTTPLGGQSVTVEAIVVGDFQDGASGTNGDLNGFYLQEEDVDADADAATSEGLFVFDGSNPAVNVAVGDLVRVTGTAGEFSGQTQIGTVTSVEVISSGNTLPMPGTLDLPAGAAAREALEGMLVNISDEAFITEYFNYGRFGEIVVSVDDAETNQPGTDGRLDQFTQFNAPDAVGFAAYQAAIADRRLIIDDGRSVQNPDPALLPDGTIFSQSNSFRGGDTLEDFTGVLGFGFGEYRLQPVADIFPNAITSQNPRLDSPEDVGGSLKVASLNVLNFFTTLDVDGNLGSGPNALDPRGADDQGEFDRQLEKLLTALYEIDADIYGLVELENEFGSDQNGDGKFAVGTLVAEYNTKYGTSFAYVDPGVPYVDSTDAISVGFIYDTQTVEVTYGTTVERLTDADLPDLGLPAGTPVFDGDSTNRASIAATFTEIATGADITLAVNHFKSKGGAGTGDDADQGDGQGSFNDLRTKAAEALNAWLESDPTGSGDTDFMILGDLNAYGMEDPVMLLKDAGYTDLVEEFVGPEAYSFVFDGQFGTLDYALASESLLPQVTGATEWRINSDEPNIIDYDTSFKRDAQDALFDGSIPFRSSDHDPIIVGLNLVPEAPDSVVARVEFENMRWGDRATYSLDGEVLGTERLRLKQQTVVIEDAGLVIGADDGRALGLEFITTAGEGIGVRSFFGDRFRDLERVLVDDVETLSFELSDIDGAGDSLALALEFATVQGAGEVALTFYIDDQMVETVTLGIVGNALEYDLSGHQTFDRVEVGTTGGLSFSVAAVEFDRVIYDDGINVA